MLKEFVMVAVLLQFCACDESKASKDSYLKAYAQTKILNEKSDYDAYYPEQNHGYHPPNFGGYPEAQYEKPYYGPPKPAYGPPAYAPSAPNYGPPPPQNYGPPDQFLPHALLGILDKIKYKIDLLTIGKIILKLVIFKKIVLFIAIICLLLFIPSLKKKHFSLSSLAGGNHDDVFRSFNNPGGDTINNVMLTVVNAIEHFTKEDRQSR